MMKRRWRMHERNGSSCVSIGISRARHMEAAVFLYRNNYTCLSFVDNVRNQRLYDRRYTISG